MFNSTVFVGAFLAVVIYYLLSKYFGDFLNPGRGKIWRPPANDEPREPGRLVFHDGHGERKRHRRHRSASRDASSRSSRSRTRSRSKNSDPDPKGSGNVS